MSADKDEATRLADAPERIWLQVCDDADCVESFASHDGVTWCQDRINDSDIEYVRADRIAALESARQVQDAALAVARNDFRELALRAEKLEAALEQARVALGEIEYSNDSRWQSDRATEALRAIEEVQK